MPGYFNAESVRNGYYKAAYREDLKGSRCFHQEDSRKSVQLDNTPFIEDDSHDVSSSKCVEILHAIQYPYSTKKKRKTTRKERNISPSASGLSTRDEALTSEWIQRACYNADQYRADPNGVKAVPVAFEFVKIQRQRLMPATGPISALIELWAHLPYCQGTMYTAYKDVRNIGRRKLCYGKVSSNPHEFYGCAEAMMDMFPSLSEVRRLRTYPDDMERTDKELYSHPLISFFLKNGLIYIERRHGDRNYSIKSPFYSKVNKITESHIKQSLAHPDYRAVTDNGFFFVPRDFIDYIVPGSLNTTRSRDYEKSGLEFTYTDAYYDLYLHCCYNDGYVLGSQLGAIVCLDAGDPHDPVITYSKLAERWGWSKAKVCRFFKKWSSLISVYNLDSNRGSIIYLNHFITDQFEDNPGFIVEKDVLPTLEQVRGLYVAVPKELEKNYSLWLTQGEQPYYPYLTAFGRILVGLLARIHIEYDRYLTLPPYRVNSIIGYFVRKYARFKSVSGRFGRNTDPLVYASSPPLLMNTAKVTI